ncbi:MAG: fasciclin domain-containing protein [Chitinophagaceae bacterium]|nr:fasciclin domain-containing protein [Chitinophagaceae bacterium]
MQKNILNMLVVVAITSTTFLACNNGETKTTETAAPTADTVKEEVMAPAAPKDIVDVAIGSADHTTLVAAVTAAGLVETLKGAGPFTVFAPTNAAFTALPAGTVDGLLKPESKDALTKILTYHVVAGAVKAADLKDGQKVKTVQGQELTVAIKDGKVTINGANVTAADLTGSNGVVHVIDAVLMPKNKLVLFEFNKWEQPGLLPLLFLQIPILSIITTRHYCTFVFSKNLHEYYSYIFTVII